MYTPLNFFSTNFNELRLKAYNGHAWTNGTTLVMVYRPSRCDGNYVWEERRCHELITLHIVLPTVCRVELQPSAAATSIQCCDVRRALSALPSNHQHHHRQDGPTSRRAVSARCVAVLKVVAHCDRRSSCRPSIPCGIGWDSASWSRRCTAYRRRADVSAVCVTHQLRVCTQFSATVLPPAYMLYWDIIAL